MQLSAYEKILHQALKLFYRQGIRATQVDQVIAEAGVAKRTFYRHFPTKRDLVLAFLQRRHENWLAWFEQAVESETEPGVERLVGVFDVLQQWFEAPNFYGCAFLNTAAEVRDARHAERQLARRHKQDMDQLLAKWLLQANLSDPALAGQLGLLVDGAIVRAQCCLEADYAQTAKQILRALLAGHSLNAPETTNSTSETANNQ